VVRWGPLRKNLPKKYHVGETIAGNLDRDQAQALAAYPTRRNTFRKKEIKNYSEWCRPRMIAHL